MVDNKLVTNIYSGIAEDAMRQKRWIDAVIKLVRAGNISYMMLQEL